MNNQLCIYFGPFSISFSSPSEFFINHLRQFFSGYESNRTPDFTVNIVPSKELPHPLTQVQMKWTPLIVDGNHFEMGPGVVKGSLDFNNREMNILVHDDIFLPQLLRVFHNFLYQLYHTLCLVKGIKSCFIHGCGVIKEQTGYLFIGPHQSGKTTIGQLSDGVVMHDDQIILTLHKNVLTMDSPPLPARFNLRRHPDKPCCIDRIFVIMEDVRFFMKPSSPEHAVSNLYNEIVLPLTLTSDNEREANKRKAELCFEIFKTIPLFELYFDEKGRFWKDLLSIQKG